MKILLYLGFGSLLILISYLTLHQALNFNFYHEDWSYIWDMKFEGVKALIPLVTSSDHPGEIFTYFPFYYLFDLNPKVWQWYGLFLKILASISVGLLVLGATRSKKTAVIASFLYASFWGGLEAFYWISGHGSANLIILVSLATYFYTGSYFKKDIKKYFLSLVLVLIALIFDPYRIVLLLPILSIWEIAQSYVDKRPIFNLRQKINLLFLFLSTTLIIVFKQERIINIFRKHIETSDDKNFLATLNNLFSTIQNLISYGLTNPNALGGIILIIAILILALRYLHKKQTSGPALILYLLFIVIFLLPNIINESSTFAPDHRYLALTSLGFIGIISLTINRLPKAYIMLVLSIYLIYSLFFSNKILADRGIFRTTDITQKYFNRVDSEIGSRDTRGSLFLTRNSGNPVLFSQIINASGDFTLPFALKRDIRDEKLLGFSVDDEYAAKLICNKNMRRPYLIHWLIQKEATPLDKIYSWYLNENNQLENITDTTRVVLAHKSECLGQKVNEQISENAEVTSIVFLKELFDEKQQVVSLAWQFNSAKIPKIKISLYNNNQLIKEETFDNIKLTPYNDIYITPVFFNLSLPMPNSMKVSVTDDSVTKEIDFNL